MPFLPRHRRRKKLHTSRTPTPDASPRGRHHLGIRGRLFLGIGGRDHFGIRGRIASEFAHRRITLGIALPVTDSGAAKSRFADDKSGNAYRDSGCGWQVKNQRARTQRQGRKVSKNVQAVEQSAEGQLSCGFHLIHDAIFFALGVLRFRIPAAACL
ncbi:hypothetical protein CN153_30135 [Sinorhizobium meliloti]|nr:hypothetical protein CN153_30135 [Sinorhizobium meliloti]